LETGLNDLNQVEKGIKLVLQQFKTSERLSDFEKGQADGLKLIINGAGIYDTSRISEKRRCSKDKQCN
jgi:hypothetical protein